MAILGSGTLIREELYCTGQPGASVSTSTTLYNSNTGYKLTYSSNGSNWSYTGTWSYV